MLGRNNKLLFKLKLSYSYVYVLNYFKKLVHRGFPKILSKVGCRFSVTRNQVWGLIELSKYRDVLLKIIYRQYMQTHFHRTTNTLLAENKTCGKQVLSPDFV